MTKIDIHVHMGTFPSVEAAEPYLRKRKDVASFRMQHPEKYAAYISEEPQDNGEKLLSVMDKHDVEISMIQPRPGITNEFVAKIAQRNPSRLVPLAVPTPWPTAADQPRKKLKTITPTAAAEELEHCASLGIRAVGELYLRRITNELHPESIVDDLEPIMQVIEAYSMSVQLPTAWTQFPGGLIYGDPLWVDELAYRYPTVPIVLTKMGRGLTRFFESTLTVAFRNQNIYVDTSDSTVEHLSKFIKTIGADRVLFGTDWSPTWQFLQDPGSVHENAVSLISNSNLSDTDLEKIYYLNSSKLYKSAIEHWKAVNTEESSAI